MPIFRNMRLYCWTTTLAVSFLVCCVLEFGFDSPGVVSGLPAETDKPETCTRHNNKLHAPEFSLRNGDFQLVKRSHVIQCHRNFGIIFTTPRYWDVSYLIEPILFHTMKSKLLPSISSLILSFVPSVGHIACPVPLGFLLTLFYP